MHKNQKLINFYAENDFFFSLVSKLRLIFALVRFGLFKFSDLKIVNSKFYDLRVPQSVGEFDYRDLNNLYHCFYDVRFISCLMTGAECIIVQNSGHYAVFIKIVKFRIIIEKVYDPIISNPMIQLLFKR